MLFAIIHLWIFFSMFNNLLELSRIPSLWGEFSLLIQFTFFFLRIFEFFSYLMVVITFEELKNAKVNALFFCSINKCLFLRHFLFGSTKQISSKKTSFLEASVNFWWLHKFHFEQFLHPFQKCTYRNIHKQVMHIC